MPQEHSGYDYHGWVRSLWHQEGFPWLIRSCVEVEFLKTSSHPWKIYKSFWMWIIEYHYIKQNTRSFSLSNSVCVCMCVRGGVFSPGPPNGQHKPEHLCIGHDSTQATPCYLWAPCTVLIHLSCLSLVSSPSNQLTPRQPFRSDSEHLDTITRRKHGHLWQEGELRHWDRNWVNCWLVSW